MERKDHFKTIIHKGVIMERKDYFKTIIYTGVIMALLCAVPAWTNWIFNYTLNGYLTFFYQVAAIFAVLYIYGKRVAEMKATENGYTFGQAFGFAIFVSIVGGLVSGCISWLLMNVVDPAIAQKTIVALYEQADKSNLQGAARETVIATGKFFFSFMGLISINLLSMITSGGIIGLITSALVQRKPQL